MRQRYSSSCLNLIITAVVLTFLHSSSRAVLVPLSPSFRVGFYNQSCPAAESIVRSTIISHFSRDLAVPARLIRLIFHECFVTGCDASLLVNSTTTNQAEKAAIPNLTVGGYEVVDAAKDALEKACPGIVSCADIEVLLARDAVALLGGPQFSVPMGRLDGRNSSAAVVLQTLPSLTATVSELISKFGAKGFNVLDIVTLLGAHTVGAVFCNSFSYRLYNFRGTNKPDTFMDPALLIKLRNLCPRVPVAPDPLIALDQGNNSINVFDSGFYRQILKEQAVLQVDQAIGIDNRTAPFVSAYVGNLTSGPSMSFSANFAAVFVKLSRLDVITGNSSFGRIRTNCAIIS